MSNVSNDTQKADQIAHRFYTKLTLVVNHARATAEPNPQVKVDKWFNLETPDADIFKEHTRIYRSISSSLSPPSFQLQVLLCVPELTPNQVLSYVAPDSSRAPVDPTPKYILLESWSLDFTPHQVQYHYADDRVDVAPPTIYKHGISLFRSIFTLLRMLPAWKLARRLRRPAGNFAIQVRVEAMENRGSDGILGFESLVQNVRLPQDTHEFPSVPHPMGTLSFSVTYLTSPNFKVVDRESLLSSRFLSQDEGPEFTPTLLKNQQRDSVSGSPGSLPVRTSLPRSPPSSVAERFVLPPPSHTRTTSLSGGSPRHQVSALPMVRATSGAGPGAGSISGLSDTSSVRHGPPSTGSREDLMPSALAARLRRESLGMGRTGSDSQGAGPLPIRRPPLGVNPFKSSTISSGSPSLHSPSPSLRQHSPLTSGGGPSLPSRPAHSSPTSSRAPGLPSPISAAGRLPSSPITPFRPSPPTVPSNLGGPSSLGDRRSLASVEGAGISGEPSPKMPGTKRYSSSFGYRYDRNTAGGPGSEGSTGGGVTPEKPANASYLSTNTDDDDISTFVQDIDARKPLSGLREQGSQDEPDNRAEPTAVRTELAGSSRSRTTSVPILTSASAVDERLREMNDNFLASLRGLGGKRKQSGHDKASSAGSSTARAPSSGTSTIGRRTLDPLSFTQRTQDASNSPPLLRRPSGAGGVNVGLPAAYVRPRLVSTGSVRSELSIASGEVLGRMDPEFDDERRRSRFSRDFTE